jgi:3-hydroxyisobutyryl-CoA hydrolase
VTLWNGFIIGGGNSISINSKFRVAAENTSYSMPESLIGYGLDNGSTYYLPRLCDPHVGLYLGVTGRSVKGKDVVKYGLATNYVKSESFEAIKDEIIKKAHLKMSEGEIREILQKYEVPIDDMKIEDLP